MTKTSEVIYRTIVLKFRKNKIDREQETAIWKAVELNNKLAKGENVESPPEGLPKSWYYNQLYFMKDFKLGTQPKKKLCHLWAMLDVQIRLNNERDRGRCIFVDLSKAVLKIRGFGNRKSIVLKLDKGAVRSIRRIVSEGARAVMARVRVDEKFVLVDLVFARERPELYEPERVMVIDVNAWNNGIAYGIINRNGKLAEFSIRRPNLRYLEILYVKVLKLERKWGRLKRLGLDKTLVAKRIRREAKACRSKMYRYLKDFCSKLVHELVQKALRLKCKIIIDEVPDTSIRQLKEQLLDSGLAKFYLTYLRRFVKLLENQCKWYGIPLEKRRLPSTICPKCGHKLEEKEHRLVQCPKCGLTANRDQVPILYTIHFS